MEVRARYLNPHMIHYKAGRIYKLTIEQAYLPSKYVHTEHPWSKMLISRGGIVTQWMKPMACNRLHI